MGKSNITRNPQPQTSDRKNLLNKKVFPVDHRNGAKIRDMGVWGLEKEKPRGILPGNY